MWFWVFILVAIVGAAWWNSQHNDGWLSTQWYAWRYGVSSRQVFMDRRQKGCDYYYAPVGYKGCSYKVTVAAFDTARNLVGGDNAPPRPPGAAESTVTEVVVRWQRTED
jgi:hypothetical protein